MSVKIFSCLLSLCSAFFPFLCYASASTNAPIPSSPASIEENYSLDFWGHFYKMILALAFILFLLYLASWVLKKTLNSRMESLNKHKNIKVLETRSLNPKNHLHLVEIEDRKFLIGESPAGLHPLADIYKTPNFSTFMQPPSSP